MPMLREEEAEMIAQKFAEKLQQARSVSDTEHYAHHRWIAKQIERDEARTRLFDELTKHVMKWGIIGVVSFIFYGAYLAARAGLLK